MSAEVELQQLIDKADAASLEDSNDDEIDALHVLVETMLARLQTLGVEVRSKGWELCSGCGVPVTPHAGDQLDIDGNAFCDAHYDDCPACQDGEPHPHWVEL